MTQDSTFEFERKCNRPERYDRNLAENTLKAIKKINKIRVAREERHHSKRVKKMVQAMIHHNKVAVILEEKDLLLQLQAPSSTTSVISPQPILLVGSSITVGYINENTSLNPAMQVPKKPEEVEE
ncbi:hypothetical protein Q3G72_029239 [Acer saccharum]|nr:hypothetical protein Q3G72_029239 [Acer saccharum]